MTTEFITLNVWNTENIRVKINQGEVNSRFLTIQIIDKNQPLDLTGKEVFFYAKKPDGNLIFNRCEILDAKDGTVNLAVTSQMSIVSGIMQDCELDVLDENLSKLKVKGLIVEIEKCTDFDSATESTSEFSVLDTSLKLVQELIDAYSDENVMAKIMSMDGAGSGLDADLLDGKQGSEYATLEQFQNAVPITRKINSKALTSDVTLTASDVGAAATSHNHSAADVTSGTLPIERGGTGETSVKGVQSALKIFTDVSQLKVDYPCTTGDIVYAMPTGSIGFFNVEASSATITDVPTGFSFLEIYKSTQNRVRVLLNGSPSDGTSAATTFNIGQYNASTRTIDRWNRIQTSAFATPINCGGTGATTASAAITNLGAVPTSRTINSKALNSDIELNCEDIGAAPWTQTISDVDVDTIKTDGIYELRYTTFENMHVPSEIQSVAIFPAKFLLIVADINATYYQTILSEWGCYIRRWKQGANISSWKQFGGAASAPLPLTSGGTGATDAYTAQSNMGLMKRYTSLGHLGLSANYTIRDIFSAMANNTLIELDISTINVSLFPKTQGIARFFKISNNRSYAEFKCTINNGIAGSWVGYYHSDTGFSGWKEIYTSLDTVPIENGGTGATETHDAQINLGLMKRYTDFSHLTLPENYTIYDVFVAMEDNSYIEYTPGSTTPYDSSLMPAAAGSLKLIKFSQYEGYAEFWKNRRLGNAEKWIGTLRDGYDFTWIKIYTSNDTVPIANGGTGATTLTDVQKNLQIYTSVMQLGLTYPCAMSDILKVLPTGSIANFGFDLKSAGITDAPINYGEVSIFFPSTGRRLIFCNQCISSGGEFSNFYIGYYISSENTIKWFKIPNGSMVTSIANGGTGATTASAARSNLGAVPITRKINEKPLDEDVALTPSDIGAAADNHTHAMSNITSGVLPIIMGGTGADNATDAQKNLQWYSSWTQIGLEDGCSTFDIVNALPNNSIFSASVPAKANVSDIPIANGQLTIIKSDTRKIIFYNQSVTGGTNGNNFYFGEYRPSYILWFRIFTSNPNCKVPIANGGTGATSASEALTSLGAAKDADVGDVSNLETSAKTIVGAVNEVHNALENLAVETGNVEASDIYTMQSSLGLMKRYTNFNHLTLNDGYTLKDVFMAMENNTCIEYPITSSMNITVCPINSGMLKIVRITQYFGYAEFWSNLISENSMWVGSLHSDRGFTWNKIYTSNKTVPIENGGTGATTVDGTLKNLKLYTSVGDLGLSYPCTTVDIIQAMPTNSEVKISINSRSGSITDLPLDYCLLTVRYSGLNRYQIFCTNMVSTGSEGTYIGNYVRNTSISWEKIITDGQVLSVANGGTGAATASEALSNLGAVPTSRKVNSKALINDITLSASDVGALSASSIKYGLIYLPVGKKFPSQTWTTCVISTTDFIADKTVLGLWPSLIYGNTMEDGSGSKSMSLMPVICGWYDNMKQLNLKVYNFSSNDLYIVENNEHAFKASYVPK